jgi:hypothetical protein
MTIHKRKYKHTIDMNQFLSLQHQHVDRTIANAILQQDTRDCFAFGTSKTLI